MNKLLLGLAIGTLACVVLFTRFDCGKETTVKQVNMDSLNTAYEDALMKERMGRIETERERDEAKKELSQQVELMRKANTTLTASNEKVKVLIAENRKLKAVNDTLGLVTNCNELVADAYNLTVAVDSLQSALAESEETARSLIEMQDVAIEAANDAALKADQFAKKVMEELAVCQVAKVKESKKEKKKRFWQRVGDFLKGAFVGGAAKSIADAVK